METVLRFSGVTDETKSKLQALSLVPVIDLVAILLVAFLLLHGIARWALVAVGVAAVVFVWLQSLGLLLHPHLLAGNQLAIRQGFGFRMVIGLTDIAAVQPYREGLPESLRSSLLRVEEEEEKLLCLMGRTGLTEVVLTEAHDVVVRGTRFSVRRVVLSLHDAGAFTAALAARIPQHGAETRAKASPALAVVSTGLPVDAPRAPGTGEALLAQNLRKSYGDFKAVDGVTLRVPYGQVVGFLGSNGAGKTTTIRMIAGLLPADGGTVSIAGSDALKDSAAARRAMGYVPDTPVLYDRLTGREYLWLIGELFDLPRELAQDRAPELLNSFAMARAADRLAGTYSLGMRKKLSIAAALMHRPKLLLLDEPTNGLDPRSSYEVKQVVANLSSGGVGVLLATHHLDLVEELCSEINIIDAGRLVAAGTGEELRSRLGTPNATLEQVFLSLTAAD